MCRLKYPRRKFRGPDAAQTRGLAETEELQSSWGDSYMPTKNSSEHPYWGEDGREKAGAHGGTRRLGGIFWLARDPCQVTATQARPPVMRFGWLPQTLDMYRLVRVATRMRLSTRAGSAK